MNKYGNGEEKRNKIKRWHGSSVPNKPNVIKATATRHKQPCFNYRTLLAVDGDRETTNAVRRFGAYVKRHNMNDAP